MTTKNRKRSSDNPVVEKLPINWQRMLKRDPITYTDRTLLVQSQELTTELALFDQPAAAELREMGDTLYGTMGAIEYSYPKYHAQLREQLEQLIVLVVKKLDDIAPRNYQFHLHEPSHAYRWDRDTGRPSSQSAIPDLDITRQYCDTCCDYCVAGDLRVFFVRMNEEVTLHTVCSTIVDWGFVDHDELGVPWRSLHPRQEARK